MTTGTTGRPGGVTSSCQEQPGGFDPRAPFLSFSVRGGFSESFWCQFGDNEEGRGFRIKITCCLVCAIDSCEIAQFVRGQLCYLEIENNPGAKPCPAV